MACERGLANWVHLCELSGPLCTQMPPTGKVLSEDDHESPKWAVLIKLRRNEGTRAVYVTNLYGWAAMSEL
jgi:hypothetical protein